MEREIQVVLVNRATTKRNKDTGITLPPRAIPKMRRSSQNWWDVNSIARMNREYRSSSVSMYWPRLGPDGPGPHSYQEPDPWLAGCILPRIHICLQSPFVSRSIATLHQCPTPEDLKGLSPEDVVDKSATPGMQRPGGVKGLAKATELLKAARHSVGNTVALKEAKWMYFV